MNPILQASLIVLIGTPLVASALLGAIVLSMKLQRGTNPSLASGPDGNRRNQN
jgi:hypothetical protein